ncbi:hypothetical protein DH2020_026241 [Rehmannia glutinosa]|uniref:threonine ammonia-lyase n=1 Tax=Rehmannia glutinosa TaxID=99300 RepID=A0ABR0W0H5_REHGL
MEVLRFAPAQSPLLRTRFFTGNDAVNTNPTAVRSSRPKPLIYAVLSNPAADILPSVAKLPTGTLLTPPPPPAAEKPLLRVSPSSMQCESGYLVPNENLGNGGAVRNGTLNAMEYLTNILSSKVYDVAFESPLQLAPKLSERWGVNVWLKREDLQPVFSFKLRGAYNMMAKLPKEQLDRGVICSSAGNHAQGVALSAQKLGCNAVIVMPVTTPEIKEGRTFIPPFDHPDVIIGQGTVGMEIVRQMKGPIEAIFVPVGGGGLIAGIAAYVKRVSPEVKIIGVEPFDANAMALSLHYGQRVTLDQVGGFADGVAVKVVGEETFRLCKELIDGVVLVSRDAICASIKEHFRTSRCPFLAGAEAYCKYYGLKGANVVAVTSGANMNFDRLRLVTELADVGRRKEAVLATYMPEEPGSFKRFCELVGPMNITEFKYRYNSDKEKSLVLYSVGLHTEAELDAMVEKLKSSQLHTINLTENDLVKDHLRHLGETGANVLVGIQVPDSEMDEFRDRANSLGYEYEVETRNEAFQLLMR